MVRGVKAAVAGIVADILQRSDAPSAEIDEIDAVRAVRRQFLVPAVEGGIGPFPERRIPVEGVVGIGPPGPVQGRAAVGLPGVEVPDEEGWPPRGVEPLFQFEDDRGVFRMVTIMKYFFPGCSRSSTVTQNPPRMNSPFGFEPWSLTCITSGGREIQKWWGSPTVNRSFFQRRP